MCTLFMCFENCNLAAHVPTAGGRRPLHGPATDAPEGAPQTPLPDTPQRGLIDWFERLL